MRTRKLHCMDVEINTRVFARCTSMYTVIAHARFFAFWIINKGRIFCVCAALQIAATSVNKLSYQ